MTKKEINRMHREGKLTGSDLIRAMLQQPLLRQYEVERLLTLCGLTARVIVQHIMTAPEYWILNAHCLQHCAFKPRKIAEVLLRGNKEYHDAIRETMQMMQAS